MPLTSHFRLRTISLVSLIFLLHQPSATVRAQDTASFQGLGDLPGGTVNSVANAVSADGSVVAGVSSGNPGGPGFRWTASAGMQSIGSFPNSGSGFQVRGISGDGNVIVGVAFPSSGWIAYRWTAGGYTSLGTLLGGSDINVADGVNYDGSIIVGFGTNADTIYEAWMWNGAMQGLGYVPDGNSSAATDVSPDGSVIVGHDRIYPVNPATGRRIAFRSFGGALMESLGLGSFLSTEATGVSADGSVIAGIVLTGEFGPFEAARWTEAGGWEILDGLAGPGSTAFDISADGSVIVGRDPSGAFVWKEPTGVRNLKEVLQNVYGLDLTGWTLQVANAVSDDGHVIVGGGTNPGGQQEAWRAVLPDTGMFRPKAGEVWISGTTDTIRWSFPSMDTVAIAYSTDYVNGAGTFQDIVSDLPADSGSYAWKIPDTLLSRKCVISVTDTDDPSHFELSGVFRLKPYVLTRNTQSGDYDAYDPITD